MNSLNFTVEVHCLHLCPNIGYRLYSNNDLLAERNWRWVLNVHIAEDIWVNLSLGINHSIRIEPVKTRHSPTFVLKHFNILSDHPINVISINEHAVTFRI